MPTLSKLVTQEKYGLVGEFLIKDELWNNGEIKDFKPLIGKIEYDLDLNELEEEVMREKTIMLSNIKSMAIKCIEEGKEFEINTRFAKVIMIAKLLGDLKKRTRKKYEAIETDIISLRELIPEEKRPTLSEDPNRKVPNEELRRRLMIEVMQEINPYKNLSGIMGAYVKENWAGEIKDYKSLLGKIFRKRRKALFKRAEEFSLHEEYNHLRTSYRKVRKTPIVTDDFEIMIDVLRAFYNAKEKSLEKTLGGVGLIHAILG